MAKKAKPTTQVVTKEKIDAMENAFANEVKTASEVKTTPKDKWEIKQRDYYLIGNKKPLSYSIKAQHIYYFDEELGYERELKYCENQRTPFVDEMKGDQRLSHIVFRNGVLHVPREKTILQKFLSLYHPHRDKLYYEWKPVQQAEKQLDWLEFEVAALQAANDLEVDMMEAVMRVENGSRVSSMSYKELKRDLLIFAKRNPQLFLELVTDDNIQLRNFGIKATEAGILSLTSDQRTFNWASTGRKIMTVPFDEHPYSALAAWFKTDEGMEVHKNIEKRMK